LRDRSEDIPLFKTSFLNKLNQFSVKSINGVHPQVIESLRNYSWPGNIRELENLVERAYILEASSVLTPENFPSDLFEAETTSVFIPSSEHMTLAQSRQRGIEEIENNFDSYEDLDYDLGMDINPAPDTIEMDELDGDLWIDY
jgi:DNA-binding NtrC family response regulator